MELDGERLIQLQFGRKKRIQLMQTSYERCVVGQQGYLLGSLSSKWIFCIPPGALDYEQDVAVSFYHVIDSVGLDHTEFVTGIIEITPHQLKFSKPVELLLRHHLCIEDDSSEVTVLYHSGETISETFTSLCQLSSVDETACPTDMKISLWDDFVHIETPHLCRFTVDCKGKNFLVVWASLFAPECPDQKHFYVRLSLTSEEPFADDEEAKRMKMSGLVCRNHHRVILRCDKQEKLRIDVQILPDASGWKVLGGSVFHETIAYNDIKDMVVHGRPLKTTDFLFSKGQSQVDVADVSPVFKFNGARCVLLPPALSKRSSSGTAVSHGGRRRAASISTATGNLRLYSIPCEGYIRMVL